MARKRYPPGQVIPVEQVASVIAAAEREDDWMRFVIDTATTYGYRYYHTHDSRRSPFGYPDLCLIHREKRRLIYIELKTETGVLTLDQYEWLDDLRQIRGVEVYVWQPSDRDEVLRVLAA